MNTETDGTGFDPLFFHQLLAEDVIIAESALKKSNTNYDKRTYIRTVFSKIEGDISLTKELSLRDQNYNHIKLSAAELAVLNEETYFLNEKGEVNVKNKHLPLIENLLFTINAVAKVNGFKPRIHKKNKGWDALKEAIKIRNRITHPKKPTDLNVTDEEVKKVRLAYLWTHYTFSYCHIETLRAFKKILIKIVKAHDKGCRPSKSTTKSEFAKIIEETDKLGKLLGIENQ